MVVIVLIIFPVFCRSRIKIPKEIPEKEISEDPGSPGKHSLCTTHEGSINHQTVTGQIGSKVVPVSVVVDSFEADNNNVT